MHHARRLVREATTTVAAVAGRVGYQTEPAFSRAAPSPAGSGSYPAPSNATTPNTSGRRHPCATPQAPNRIDRQRPCRTHMTHPGIAFDTHARLGVGGPVTAPGKLGRGTDNPHPAAVDHHQHRRLDRQRPPATPAHR